VSVSAPAGQGPLEDTVRALIQLIESTSAGEATIILDGVIQNATLKITLIRKGRRPAADPGR
jgi:hypothetical protein